MSSETVGAAKVSREFEKRNATGRRVQPERQAYYSLTTDSNFQFLRAGGAAHPSATYEAR